MERSDIRVTTSGDMPVMVWKDKLYVHMLTHFHNPPAEGNFILMTAKLPEATLYRITITTWVVLIEVTDWITAASCHMWKWTKNCHFINLTTLNSHTLFQSHGSKLSIQTTIWHFEEYGRACWPPTTPLKTVSRPALVTRIGHLEVTSHQHWLPTTERKLGCAMCHAPIKRTYGVLKKKCEKHCTEHISMLRGKSHKDIALGCKG
jgi:hypothetical protein